METHLACATSTFYQFVFYYPSASLQNLQCETGLYVSAMNQPPQVARTLPSRRECDHTVAPTAVVWLEKKSAGVVQRLLVLHLKESSPGSLTEDNPDFIHW